MTDKFDVAPGTYEITFTPQPLQRGPPWNYQTAKLLKMVVEEFK